VGMTQGGDTDQAIPNADRMVKKCMKEPKVVRGSRGGNPPGTLKKAKSVDEAYWG